MANAGSEAERKDGAKSKERSIAWMRVYIGAFLWIAFSLALYSIADIMGEVPHIAGWLRNGLYPSLIRFLVQATASVTTVITFIQMRRLKPSGYWWNVAMLWSNFANVAADVLTLGIVGLPSIRVPAESTIAVIIAPLLWVVPNLIYFRKRKHLFRGYTAAEVKAIINGELLPPR